MARDTLKAPTLRQVLWKSACRFLKTLKLELPCDLALPLLGTQGLQTSTPETYPPVFMVAIVTTAEKQSQPRHLPVEQQIKNTSM